MSPTVLAAVAAGLGLVLTAGLTPLVRRAALGAGMVRDVQADRWHRRPTPAVGGVAIFLGFGAAVGVAYLLDPGALSGFGFRPAQALTPWTPGEGLVLGASLAFLLGLVDDLVHLRPMAKLLGQVAAAAVLLASGIGVWLTGWYAVDAALSLFWFVGITNAVNLLDNMDGLATGVAAVAGAYLALLFGLEGSTGLMVLALAFTAALLGFLVHNYPPARIFMGDSGSLFIGLFLAGLALAPAEGLSRSLAAVMAAPVLILGVPIMDTTLVTIGRVMEGRPVSQGGRDHTSHRFVDLGLTEARTVWLLWGLALAGGGVGALLRSAERGTALVLGGVVVGALTLVGAYLLSVRMEALEEEGAREPAPYHVLIRMHERYPIFAFLLDAVWIALAYYAAYVIRWDPAELPRQIPYFERTVALWVTLKLLVFLAAGMYGTRWPTFGLYDALRVVRANLLAVAVTVAVVLLADRVGLSRGIVFVDLMVCTLLTLGGRLSFRLLDGTTRRWSAAGRPAVLLGPVAQLPAAVAALERQAAEDLRVVALACTDAAQARGRLGAFRLFGGADAVRDALGVTGARWLVLVGTEAERARARTTVGHAGGPDDGVEVLELEVRLRPTPPPPPEPAAGVEAGLRPSTAPPPGRTGP